jgi:hypothetical protein
LGKAIFLFFVVVTTVVAALAPSSYHCGGGDSDGRTTETFIAEDPRLGDTRAS